jgi:integrase
MGRKRRGRGEGAVYQRESDGLWVGSVSLGIDAKTGKRKRRPVYGRTKQDAQEKLRRLQHQADRGALADDATITVAAWLEHWLTVIAPTVEPGTLAPYRRHVERHLKPRLGRTKLHQFRAGDVEALYAGLLADGVSAALARKIGTTLTVALNHAVRKGKIVGNPAAGVKKPKADKPELEILTPEQARTLAGAAADHRLGPLWLLMLDAGTGPGETFALSWPDVSADGRSIQVTKSLENIDGKLRVKKPKNKWRVRRIQLSAGTATALVAHREKMKGEGRDTDAGPVFVDDDGGYLRISNIHQRHWKPFLKSAKLPDVSLYALRHTMATLLLLAGVNPKIVSERLGHSTVTLTLDTYSHVLPTMQHQAAEVLGKLLGPEAQPQTARKPRRKAD